MEFTGNIVEYFTVFAAGVAVSFTPCVYPVLPITASYIGGANSSGSKLIGFWISLLYVLGVAITYCLLAVIAALSGKVFGAVQSHPVIYIVVANIFILFSLVMFDIIPIPTIGKSYRKKKLTNVWSVILFGMVSGLVIGPCMAPVMGSLLLYIGSKQNLLHAISLMFVFSYGVGFTLILVGTFSGIISSLPKSGEWMVRVKQICGLILLILAEVYLIKAGALMI